MNFQVSNFCEIDKYAIESYCRIHNEDKNKNLGDITNVKSQDIADCNVIVGGSPCFTKDTLVLTNKGYKQLKDVDIGDLVLSHDGKFHKVTDFLNQGTKQIYTIKSNCFSPIKTTSNHRFYAKTEGGMPEWVEAKNLGVFHYLGCYVGEPKHAEHIDNKHLYVYGLFLRYGVKIENKHLVLMVTQNTLDVIRKDLYKYDISFSIAVNDEEDCIYVDIYNTNIHLVQNIINLSIEQSEIVLSGFFANIDIKADVFLSDDLCLLHNISYLFMKCYKKPCTFKKYHNEYSLAFQSYISNWHVEDNYIWYPISVSSSLSHEEVFDLTIEDAHSFVVRPIIAKIFPSLAKEREQCGHVKIVSINIIHWKFTIQKEMLARIVTLRT